MCRCSQSDLQKADLVPWNIFILDSLLTYRVVPVQFESVLFQNVTFPPSSNKYYDKYIWDILIRVMISFIINYWIKS
jgi:hypothetical protein